jgi:hypothetical protein
LLGHRNRFIEQALRVDALYEGTTEEFAAFDLSTALAFKKSTLTDRFDGLVSRSYPEPSKANLKQS